MTSSVRRVRALGSGVAAAAVLIVLGACHQGSATSAPAPKSATAQHKSGSDSVDVGYGNTARRDVTGSIGTVSGDVVRQTTATSMADMLEGRVPGLEVRRNGSNISVRIRGDRSFHAEGDPLFVVDGIPVAGTSFLVDMDPREVKRIEVLKDAGSLAAYGSRGANGVILISLRKPPKP
jgi:TonB-dependent SusC/RagA subfamily outer membrane receptor